MDTKVLGLHHITALAGNAKRNLDFYTQTLGMKLVKKTVNFDDPSTYHFYFGNAQAEPGSILTFFPWTNILKGKLGTGQASEVLLAVSKSGLDFWTKYLEQHNIQFQTEEYPTGEVRVIFADPDGLTLALVGVDDDTRQAHATDTIAEGDGIKGFYGTTLRVADAHATLEVLTDLLDYELIAETAIKDGINFRLQAKYHPTSAVVNVVETFRESQGLVAGGSVHHVAFRVKDSATQMALREKIVAKGFADITPQVDRQYFKSLYFREPNGILFEIATDTPGFCVDEAFEKLGSRLQLPPQYEGHRNQIEENLPSLT